MCGEIIPTKNNSKSELRKFLCESSKTTSISNPFKLNNFIMKTSLVNPFIILAMVKILGCPSIIKISLTSFIILFLQTAIDNESKGKFMNTICSFYTEFLESLYGVFKTVE